jgi:RHS repeat-associated protein
VNTLVDNVYYYQDELGSTSHIANASGALLEYYKYNLYGAPTYFDANNNQLSTTNYSVKDLGNGGGRWMPELGLYDLRNRFMSPNLGRFLQPDPIGFKGDASNLYRYCGNDWANGNDPMGTADEMKQPVIENDRKDCSEGLADDAKRSAVNVEAAVAYQLSGGNNTYYIGTGKGLWHHAGNFSSQNLKDHVKAAGTLHQNDDPKQQELKGRTDSRAYAELNSDGHSVTLVHKMNWYVDERYQNTDVVTREIATVQSWLSWEREGGGDDVLSDVRRMSFSSAQAGVDRLNARLQTAEFKKHEELRRMDYSGGSHDASRYPPRPISAKEIENAMSTLRE